RATARWSPESSGRTSELHHDPEEPAPVDVGLRPVLELRAGPAVADVGEAVAEHLDLTAQPGVVEVLSVDERHDVGGEPGVAAQAHGPVARNPAQPAAGRARPEVGTADVPREILAAEAARDPRVPPGAVSRREQADVGQVVLVIPVVHAAESPGGRSHGLV